MASATRWISSKRKVSTWLLLLALALGAGLASCDDGPTGTQEEEDPGPDATVVFRGLTVSDVDDAAPGGSPLAAATPGVAYISACPGTFSDADSITITNLANGETRTVQPIDGGFDPVALDAEPDDEIEIVIHHSDGSTSRYLTHVPARRRPRVVRTVPPKDATDVVLSATVLAVFSEPIDSNTLTPETFQLQLQLTGDPVEGALALTDDGLRAEFTPAEPLRSGTPYSLVITTGVLDLEGDPLEEEVRTTFTTEGPSPFVSVSPGYVHTCAARADGRTYCWGSNNWGQLGPPATGMDDWSANPPTRVPTPARVAFTSLSAGGGHTCALTPAGRAWCWGFNELGDLGIGTTTLSSQPVEVSGGHSFVSLTAGDGLTCGLTGSGTVYCWGVNHFGQLATSEAPETCTWTHTYWDFACSTTPLRVSGGLRFTYLAAGKEHVCGVTATGVAYCWGLNEDGQLGSETSETCSWRGVPWACSTTPLPVSGTLRFRSVGAGYAHTCGLTTLGAAYCWGSNGSGQLGDGTTTSSSEPVAVEGTRSYVSIAAGKHHTCALTDSREAFCWGANEEWAQLGIGVHGGVYPEPVAVSGNHDFEALSTWMSHTCALTTDGDVFCWGYNGEGELGIPPSATPEGCSAVPVRVSVP